MRPAPASIVLAAGWLAVLGVYLAIAPPAFAANFLSAQYDQERDEIVVTLAYRGTNPDHEFSIDWGTCRADAAGGNSGLSREPFTKTVRFTPSVWWFRRVAMPIGSCADR